MAGKKGNIFLHDGRLRAIWLVLIAVMAYRILSYAVRIGLNMAFASLFSAWRVNAGNIHLAPRWAQMIYSWHGSFITVAVCLVGIVLSLILRRMWIGEKCEVRTDIRAGAVPAALGAGIAIVSAAIFLIADSMRLEWPVLRPRFSVGILLMLPVTLLTVFSEELFTKAVLFDGVLKRSRRFWAYTAAICMFFLFNGGYSGNVVSGVNVLLMGAVCCILYAEHGLWAPVLFRGMWSYTSVFIAGFGASSAAQSVYRLYGVSEKWLTGGDGGMIYGLWMTALMIVIIAWMKRREIVGLCAKIRAGKSK